MHVYQKFLKLSVDLVVIHYFLQMRLQFFIPSKSFILRKLLKFSEVLIHLSFSVHISSEKFHINYSFFQSESQGVRPWIWCGPKMKEFFLVCHSFDRDFHFSSFVKRVVHWSHFELSSLITFQTCSVTSITLSSWMMFRCRKKVWKSMLCVNIKATSCQVRLERCEKKRGRELAVFLPSLGLQKVFFFQRKLPEISSWEKIFMSEFREVYREVFSTRFLLDLNKHRAWDY